MLTSRFVSLLSVVLLLSLGLPAFAMAADSHQAEREIARQMHELIDRLQDATDGAHPELLVLKRKLDSLMELAAPSPQQPTPPTAPSTELPADYAEFYAGLGNLSDGALLDRLQKKTSGHHSISYSEARRVMFLKLDNIDGVVECVYTGRTKNVGSQMPNSSDMNCEHTWPQSLGATGVAKSDIHHLYPTDSQANSRRGSYPFGWAKGIAWQQGGSALGSNKVFEVRPQQRGNTARSIFYFAMRYGKKLDATQEATLREWDKQDPVDAYERKRCDGIFEIQGNRNPFVDHPELVDRVSDF